MVGPPPSRSPQSDGRGLRSSGVAGVRASSRRSRTAWERANPFAVDIAMDSRLPPPHWHAGTGAPQDFGQRLDLARNWHGDCRHIQAADAEHDLEARHHLEEDYDEKPGSASVAVGWRTAAIF